MHGSKKWIVDYKGDIKRSNNRTKLDFYGELKWWDYPSRFRTSRKFFCPQCKHVQKSAAHDNTLFNILQKEVREDWIKLYGELRYVVKIDGKYLYFSDFFKNHPKYPGNIWQYDDRNYLCFKHETKMVAKKKMWINNLGDKSHWSFGVRRESRKYRRKMKAVMRHALLDEDKYDDLRKHVHCWLD